jgi:hypothetical protein
MITRTKIDLRENSGSKQLIKKNIDSGRRIFVLDGHYIERSVINTQPQATILLLLEFCVPLRSRVCEVESWFLGPVALQWLRGLGQLG